MARDIVLTNPETMAAPGGHYSHAVKANGFVFVAGQLPIAHDGAKLMDAPFERQAQQTLDNIAAALKAAGSAIDRLVQVRVYVTDIGSWPAFNTICDMDRDVTSGPRGRAGATTALRLQD
ncbi:MAG: RidA family protein [Pseudolabrys sp.]